MIEAFELNQKCCLPKKVFQAQVSRDVSSVSKLWQPGQQILWYAPNHRDIPVFQQALNIWTKHANLNFKRVYSKTQANLRIGWNTNLGSWSYIGTDVRYIPFNQDTINFGWPLGASPSTTALHEIGHALGLQHEHQNPNSTLKFDVERTYSFYTKNLGWSKSDVDNNILAGDTNFSVKAGVWDSKSIMQYSFPQEVISAPSPYCHEGLDRNFVLSEGDKSWAEETYPKSGVSTSPVVTRRDPTPSIQEDNMISEEGFPIKSKVTNLKTVPEEAEFMHSIVVGRNDNDLEDPIDIGLEADLFLECREQVVEGKWPASYFEKLGIDPEVPEIFKMLGIRKNDPLAAVRLVDHRMDKPMDLHNAAKDFFGGSVDPDMPEKFKAKGFPFLRLQQFDAEVHSLVYEALVDCFQAKYFFMRLRPEHWFKAGRLVTEYQCPPHGEYPAGHGAGAGATYQNWVKRGAVDTAGLEKLKHAAQHLAHYRTLAGVHWPSGNSAGFESGVKTVQRILK